MCINKQQLNTLINQNSLIDSGYDVYFAIYVAVKEWVHCVIQANRWATGMCFKP